MTNVTAKTAQIKALMATAGSRMIGITNKKVDGSLREWNVNLSFTRGLIGERASESAKRAVATRKANNPNLISVVDMKLYNAGTPVDKCWRSINLETVTSVRVNGVVYEIK